MSMVFVLRALPVFVVNVNSEYAATRALDHARFTFQCGGCHGFIVTIQVVLT